MKKQKLTKNLNKLIILMFIIMIGIMMYTYRSIYIFEKHKLSGYSNHFYNVQIEGMYKIDDGEWMEFNKDTEFDLNEHHKYYFKGHFNKNIAENYEIMMRSKDLYVDMKVNGECVLKLGYDKEHSDGNVWAVFLSDGITTDDVVEIEIYNVYTGINTNAIQVFLNQIYFGSADGLYNLAFKENGKDLVMGIAILTLGVCELLVSLIMTILHGKNIKKIVYSGGFTCMAGIWVGIRYNIISLIIPYPILLQSIEVISLQLLCLFLSLYLNTYITGRLKNAGKVNCVLIIFWTIVTILLKLVWNIDMYRIFEVTTVLCILNVIIFIIYLQYEYLVKKNRSAMIIIFFATPMFIGGLTDGIRLWLNVGEGSKGLNNGIVIAGIIQMIILIVEKRNSDKIIERARILENELIQSRISVMLSQIQPHFLYNSLNTIRYLCIEDPQKAEQAVIDFASFLRGNVDSLNSNGLITFEKELDHVNHYLSLEKIRFGDRVNVIYNIGVIDFMIPPLTLQPIVENAVRYGITKKEEGGTVTINSSETDEDYIITIHDDGVGFDINNIRIKDDKRTHVGIENVKKRLIDQCNGGLDIQSIPDKGTTVVLRVNKGEAIYENNNSR